MENKTEYADEDLKRLEEIDKFRVRSPEDLFNSEVEEVDSSKEAIEKKLLIVEIYLLELERMKKYYVDKKKFLEDSIKKGK